MRFARCIVTAIALFAIGCGEKKSAAGEPQSPPASKSSSARPDRFSGSVQGDVSAFRLTASALTYCDSRGARKLDLTNGSESAGEQACPAKPEEPNASCSGLTPEVTVRGPQGEPNDMLDINERSYAMKGRVQDCAGNGKSVIVLTSSGTTVIDAGSGTVKPMTDQPGSRVAASPGWLAWTEGSKVIVRPAQ